MLHDVDNCRQLQDKRSVQIYILSTTRIYRFTMRKTRVHYDPSVLGTGFFPGHEGGVCRLIFSGGSSKGPRMTL